MQQPTLGAVILSGGRGRRMGQEKAHLTLCGKPFLTHIIDALGELDEVLLSARAGQVFPAHGLDVVEDIFPDCGPIGGLHAALATCRSSHLLAVGCDMPGVSRGLVAYLAGFLDDTHDAFVVTTRDGRVQPLCAIYHTRVADVLERQIAAGNYRLMDALSGLRVREVSLAHTVFSDSVPKGVNTPEEYAALRRETEGAPLFAICGVKNSGKTTFLTRLIPRLVARGLRVAVIKHDGHDFVPDVPETDSYRLRVAGAYGVCVYSPHRYSITAEQTGLSPTLLARQFPDADLILLEGGKHSNYPKIELVRLGVSDVSVSDPSFLVALCTDTAADIPGVPTLALEDYDGAVRVILEWLGGL